MDCSVIITTHNRSELLRDSLKSLANQSISKKNYEILVADNYSDDKGEGSRIVCEEIKNLFPDLNLYFKKQFSKVGITQTRHELILKASSEIIVTGDDDYIAFPSLLENAIKTFKNNSIGIVAGALEPKYEVNPPDWLKSMITKTVNGYFIVELTVCDLGEEIFETEPKYALWSNMAFRKSIYEKSPGFGPDGFGGGLFYYNGSGETFYSEYIKSKGYKIIYNGKMRAYHRIFSRRFTKNYLRGRYEYYGIGDSFTFFRENSLGIYILKVFYFSIRLIKNLVFNIFSLPNPIKYKNLWRLKGLLNHAFYIFKNHNLRDYVLQNGWKDYPFQELKPLNNKNSLF